MKGYEIVREETARLARGMAPLALIAFGILLLAGFEPLRTGVSLLAGTAYSILLFVMIGRSAARAVLFPPAQGTRIVRRGYFFRYLLTGAAVFAAIRLPQLQPLAAILPLCAVRSSCTARPRRWSLSTCTATLPSWTRLPPSAVSTMFL